jgi:hypothetical protein
VGLLIGAAMVVLMALASVELWVIVVSSLVLIGATLVLISVVADARTAPVKIADADRSRGVLRCASAIRLMCRLSPSNSTIRLKGISRERKGAPLQASPPALSNTLSFSLPVPSVRLR